MAAWGVVTSDRDKAWDVFEEIKSARADANIENVICGENDLLMRFSDGVYVEWIKPIKNIKGFRMERAWIDRDIDSEIFRFIIDPMLYGSKGVVWI